MFFFEQRVVSRILEPKKDEVTGSHRKLHNETLHYVHSLPDDEDKVDEMNRACSIH
jgi:hypothetical protein